MARPRFSEALIQRRRELGLTTVQASRVLKLKEQVLIALEEGDFESIPKSGYAQGMVSSYARYLGLDAREMVELFLEDLEDYEAEVNPREAQETRSRVSQSIRLTPRSSAVDDSRRQLLPTSGGRAGDMGDFATTSRAQTRSGSVQLVNPSRMRSTSYGSYGSYGTYDDYDYEDEDDSSVTVRSRRSRSLTSREQASSTKSYRTSSGILTGDQISRSRTYDTYQDDLALRSATSFEPATSASARRQAHRIAQTERPNTRRRAQGSSRNRTTQNRGADIDDILNFVSESRVVIGIAAIVLILILLVVIFMGVQSCTRSQSTAVPQSIPVSTTVTETGTVGEGTDPQNPEGQGTENQTGEVTQQGTSEVPAGEPINAEGTQTPQTHGETISTEVSITVASGESTWLEIMADGQSRIADQVLGPWSETYVITESLTVQVTNTSAVSVFENGQSRSFDTRASGVGSITIKVPVSTPQPEAEAEPVTSE